MTIAEVTRIPRQLSLTAGGEEPDTSTFTIKSDKDTLFSDDFVELAKGDYFELRVRAKVVEVGFKDRYMDGALVGAERKHVLVATSVGFV